MVYNVDPAHGGLLSASKVTTLDARVLGLLCRSTLLERKRTSVCTASALGGYVVQARGRMDHGEWSEWSSSTRATVPDSKSQDLQLRENC